MKILHLASPFGWDSDLTAKVAISQLRERGIISATKCPKAQLIRNESYRTEPNVVKILGYIPGVNIIAGIVAIQYTKSGPGLGKHHVALWRIRGLAMIIAGPLLLVVDLIVHLYNRRIAKKYINEHPNLIQAFNTTHTHTPAYWPGHPVDCQQE